MKKHLHALNLFPTLAIVALALATQVSGCSTCCTQSKSPKRVLVVTTNGFRHSSIPTLEKTLGEMAQKSGAFTVTFAGLDAGTAEFKGADGKPDNAKFKAAVAVVLAEK